MTLKSRASSWRTWLRLMRSPPTSGYVYAQRGDLSLGPFMLDALAIPVGYFEAKLWVAS